MQCARGRRWAPGCPGLWGWFYFCAIWGRSLAAARCRDDELCVLSCELIALAFAFDYDLAFACLRACEVYDVRVGWVQRSHGWRLTSGKLTRITTLLQQTRSQRSGCKYARDDETNVSEGRIGENIQCSEHYIMHIVWGMNSRRFLASRVDI